MVWQWIRLIILIGVFSGQVFAEDFTKPILIEKSDLPELPRVLRKSNAKGIALTKISVDSAGNTIEVSLIRSTGYKILDDFIIEWMKEWKFLPKLQEDNLVDGFTMLSLRYDLSENRFFPPSVNDLTMTLPAAYQSFFMGDEPAEEIIEHDINQLQEPLSPINISKIPAVIQKKDIAVGTALLMHVNMQGKVVDIERPLAIRDDAVWAWLQKELLNVQWLPSKTHSIRKIELPLILETAVCKADFGSAQLIVD